MNSIKTFIKSLNSKITNLNKLAFVLIIAIYILALTIVLFLISPRYDKVIKPDYEHNDYAETINPRIMIVGDTDLINGELKTEYDVFLRLHGRLVDGADPRYTVQRMQLSAFTTENKFHYFTEYSGFTTPRTHSFIPIKQGAPEEFYLKIEYLDEDQKLKVETFREDVMLKLKDRNKYSQYNKIVSKDENGEEVTDLRLEVISTKLESAYRTSIRMRVGDFSKKYHIDMQSWIVTEDGKVVPYVGVYGYSDETSSFTDSNRNVPLDIKPKSIYVKVNYTVDGNTKSIYYQNEFANLTEKYADIPEVDPPLLTDGNWEIIIYAAIGAIIISGLIILIVKKVKPEKKSRKKSWQGNIKKV